MIAVNGIPKSGTHALVKCVELLGVPLSRLHETGDVCIQGHWTADSPPPEGKHIHIIRHPRNTLVSMVRFIKGVPTTGLLIAAMKSFYEEKSLVENVRAFAPWRHDPDVLTIRFENLVSDDGVTVEKIADFMEVPLLPNVYADLPGMTWSWTGKLSNWRDHWDAHVDAAWNQLGGGEAEALLDYADTL